jgi:hypothetical protein
MECWLDGRDLIPVKEKRAYVFHSVQAGSGFHIQPPIQWVPGVLSTEVKRPGRESNHSHRSIVEVRNGGAIPPIPIPIHCMVLK